MDFILAVYIKFKRTIILTSLFKFKLLIILVVSLQAQTGLNQANIKKQSFFSDNLEILNKTIIAYEEPDCGDGGFRLETSKIELLNGYNIRSVDLLQAPHCSGLLTMELVDFMEDSNEREAWADKYKDNSFTEYSEIIQYGEIIPIK